MMREWMARVKTRVFETLMKCVQEGVAQQFPEAGRAMDKLEEAHQALFPNAVASAACGVTGGSGASPGVVISGPLSGDGEWHSRGVQPLACSLTYSS